MIDVEYYWAKAEEALERADRQAVLGNYFLSVALAYRLLAFSETKFQSSRLHQISLEVGRRANAPAQIA